MSSLLDSTLLAPITFPAAQKNQLRSLKNAPRILRKATSVAALYNIARHPSQTLEGLRGVVEDWYDGSTKEEREEKALLGARKRVLYLQQRSVCNCTLSWIGIEC